jgi:hypothetical protein
MHDKQVVVRANQHAHAVVDDKQYVVHNKQEQSALTSVEHQSLSIPLPTHSKQQMQATKHPHTMETSQALAAQQQVKWKKAQQRAAACSRIQTVLQVEQEGPAAALCAVFKM